MHLDFYVLFVLSNTYIIYNVSGYVVADSLLNPFFTLLISLPKNNTPIRSVISWEQALYFTNRIICSVGHKCKIWYSLYQIVFLYCNTFYLLSMFNHLSLHSELSFTFTVNWLIANSTLIFRSFRTNDIGSFTFLAKTKWKLSDGDRRLRARVLRVKLKTKIVQQRRETNLIQVVSHTAKEIKKINCWVLADKRLTWEYNKYYLFL